MNYSGKINLLKMKNACIVTVKGNTSTKRGVFIPIEDNSLFISADDNLKPKAAYIDISVWENKQPSKFGDTHSIRQSLPKEALERMTDDEKKSIPYIGNIKPFEQVNAFNSVASPYASVDNNIDDLPF